MKRLQKRIKRNGRTVWGEYKLTPPNREEIHRRAWAGERGILKRLAAEFGVDSGTVWCIKHRAKGYAK